MDSYHMKQVPCGKCLECRKARVNSWFVRLSNELRHSQSAHFLTLTYDDSVLPFSENGLMTLQYRDFQLFMKRLRKDVSTYSDIKIKYFCVGEYGTRTHRPHYHVIMFNVQDQSLYEKHWKHGHIHIGNVEDQSIFYTLKYSLKTTFGLRPSDPDDDRIPERALQSKNLGIKYLTPQMVKYHKENLGKGTTMLGNIELPLPRYYRDKIFTDGEKKARIKSMEKYTDKRYNQVSDRLFPQRVSKSYNDALKKLLLTD